MSQAEIHILSDLEAGDAAPDSKLDAILADVSKEVVGRVRACATNTEVGSAGTIPEELKTAAIAIARHQLAASVPGLDELQGDDRKEEYRAARELLRDVAMCKLYIEPPAGAGSSSAAGCYGGDTSLDFSM